MAVNRPKADRSLIWLVFTCVATVGSACAVAIYTLFFFDAKIHAIKGEPEFVLKVAEFIPSIPANATNEEYCRHLTNIGIESEPRIEIDDFKTTMTLDWVIKSDSSNFPTHRLTVRYEKRSYAKEYRLREAAIVKVTKLKNFPFDMWKPIWECVY